MLKNLVIVESPAKAKTIEKYLGKDFTVRSSYGHIRDLPEKGIGIDIAKSFSPSYEISSDKINIVKELKKMAKEAEIVWLATDDDREGEAISWHLKESLELKDSKIKRIVFREITKKAILKAIENPRTIDLDLVNAQQARRILDRLVGYELSPVLWKKIKTGLSAGRVQSVAVRLIVEREREVEKFQSQSHFKVSAYFDLGNDKTLVAELKEKLSKQKEAEDFLNTCIDASFHIKDLETKPAKKSPAAPFTTSTLQQEASRKLGFSVAQTMTIAQKLYEAGKITYMRTDSTALSEEAIQAAGKEIESLFGKKFSQSRQYKTKSESAQEAHEAIRPTDFSIQQAGNDANEKRLYELIWKRTIASQMADAQLEKTIASVEISTNPAILVAEGEVIKFEGFLKVYLEDKDDEGEENEHKKMLPPLNKGQKLTLTEMKALERFSRPPARYTEASLVKKLEDLGIGRPSTYAPTISTIQKRGYVVKENKEGKERDYQEITLKSRKISFKTKKEITGAEKAKLFPTDTAMVVNDFLQNHFENIMDYSFTAKVEKEFDEIAEGKKNWNKMIDSFYQPFHKKVENTEEIKRSEVNAHKELGIDPVSGEKIFAKLGRYGAYVQIGEGSEEKKPTFAKLKKGQFLETITLEEALELFKLPREVGTYQNQTMTVAIGRFGPYVKLGNKFFSLGKEDDPYSITEERAIEIIENKRKSDKEKIIKSFEENPDIQVLNGRYGAYIKAGKQNVKIPKDKDPKSLTLAECLELAGQQEQKPTKNTTTKKKTK
ncbi:MAG: type I DNA topoisomerase [Thermonemataceae bacterium]|nr:type I DNA topoisomerase [Thermonemataceae bacterium]